MCFIINWYKLKKERVNKDKKGFAKRKIKSENYKVISLF